jgi:hypothetical protein
MSPIPTYSYDQEDDVLYISFSPGEKATAAFDWQAMQHLLAIIILNLDELNST